MVAVAMTDGIDRMEAVFGSTPAVKLLKDLGLYGRIKTALTPLMKIRGRVAAGTENSKTNFTIQAAANPFRMNDGKGDSSRHLNQSNNHGKVINRTQKRHTTKV
jgi:hypothetical protein